MVGGYGHTFWGDELRLAFPAADVTARDVREFVVEVARNLSNSQQHDTAMRTEIVAVALSGYLTPKIWRGCQYLHGEAAHRAQRWMGAKLLSPGELAVDSNFQSTLHAPAFRWKRLSIGTDLAWVRTMVTSDATGVS